MTDHVNQPPAGSAGGRKPRAELADLVRQASARGIPMAGTIRPDEFSAGDATADAWEIEQGTDVLCGDGDKVGEVVDIIPGYLVVEQGFFDPHDIYIPVALIDRSEEGRLVLRIDREEFERRDWSTDPATGAGAPES